MTADSFASTLRKMLQVEARKDHDDTAVMGGLDRFLARILPQVDDPLAADFFSPRPAYGTLHPAERRAWVREVLDWLDSWRPEASAPQPGRTPPPTSFGRTVAVPGTAPSSHPVTPAHNGAAQTRATPPPSPRPAAATAGEAAAKPAPRVKAGSTLKPESPVQFLPGVGREFAEKLGRLGITLVRDLLYLYPRRHVDYSRRVAVSDLQPGGDQTVIGVLWQATERRLGNRPGTEAVVGDDTGNVRAVWFNQPHVARTLGARPQAAIALSGKVTVFRGQLVFEAPEYELLDREDDERIHTGRLVPIYPGTEGLSPRTIRRLVKTALDRTVNLLIDPLPEPLLRRVGLMPLKDALWAYHYPDSDIAQEQARRRLAFEELFFIQLGVAAQRQERQQEHALAINVDRACLDGFLASLPFPLTGAQRRSIDDILSDIQLPRPMSRLLQGDVGSGKTVVAAAALMQAVQDGKQGAIMAPTEILAEQHFRSLCTLLEQSGELTWDGGYRPAYLGGLERSLKVSLLVGSLTAREKADVRGRISRGEVDLVVGTQALIQDEVSFDRLGLAVIDEQHRFGVAQRWTLRQKGESPHVLVMTATPIPRTLALTLYGDLDVSVLDEIPPGRQPIVTRWLKPSQRQDAYVFVREQVQEGRQVFVICPLVEESDVIDARAATVEYERLSKEVFSDLKLGLLHGRMTPQDKDAAMRAFRAGETHLLVSTAVVEVGIDVPNATVMLIEGADRFGLAQLHQFRGRVGRGAHQSFCLLLSDDPSREAQERLSIVQRTQDGFKLAEEDLRLRGPGEFFGTRQTGLPAFRLARLSDTELLQTAREEAKTILAADPHLAAPEHSELAGARDRAWQPGAGDLS